MLRNAQEFTLRKQRDRVVAELTFRHLMEAGREAGQFISDEEALEFLNQDDRPSAQAWALAHRR
jgi:hypothetical protein